MLIRNGWFGLWKVYKMEIYNANGSEYKINFSFALKNVVLADRSNQFNDFDYFLFLEFFATVFFNTHALIIIFWELCSILRLRLV